MPELPDILVYLESLEPRVLGRRLEKFRLKSPFVLRSVSPAVREVEGKKIKLAKTLLGIPAGKSKD